MDKTESKDAIAGGLDAIGNRLHMLSDYFYSLEEDDNGMAQISIYATKGASMILMDIEQQLASTELCYTMLMEERRKKQTRPFIV